MAAEIRFACRSCVTKAKSISERGGGLDKVETMALPHEKGVEAHIVLCNGLVVTDMVDDASMC